MLEFCSWMKIWETWCASTPLCFGNVEIVLWVRSCGQNFCVAQSGHIDDHQKD
jgi:valyl-tRNA synthetase